MSVPLQAPAGGSRNPELAIFDTIGPDDIAAMDLLLIEDTIARLRRNRLALSQGRLIEIISAGKRLATLAEEAIS